MQWYFRDNTDNCNQKFVRGETEKKQKNYDERKLEGEEKKEMRKGQIRTKEPTLL